MVPEESPASPPPEPPDFGFSCGRLVSGATDGSASTPVVVAAGGIACVDWLDARVDSPAVGADADAPAEEHADSKVKAAVNATTGNRRNGRAGPRPLQDRDSVWF